MSGSSPFFGLPASVPPGKGPAVSVGKCLDAIHYFIFSLAALPLPALPRATRPRLEMDKEESLAGKA